VEGNRERKGETLIAKNKVISSEVAEKRFQAAIRAAETLRDDPDLAEEIEDEGVDEWAERKGYTIENPRKKGGKKPMATRIKIKNSAALVEENAALKEENDDLREENEELRSTLADIQLLSSVDEDDEDEDDDDDEGDDEDDEEE